MRHIRRTLIGLLATFAALLAGAVPATAMPVPLPPGPASDPTTPAAASSGGLAIWQLALIAAASALALTIVVVAARLAAVRTHRRVVANRA